MRTQMCHWKHTLTISGRDITPGLNASQTRNAAQFDDYVSIAAAMLITTSRASRRLCISWFFLALHVGCSRDVSHLPAKAPSRNFICMLILQISRSTWRIDVESRDHNTVCLYVTPYRLPMYLDVTNIHLFIFPMLQLEILDVRASKIASGIVL